MCKILLSIHPKYVEEILNGTKIYEYRKTNLKREVNSIIVYSTSPVKKLVCEIEIVDVLKMNKNKLWDLTKEFSGITKEFFDEYYKSKDIAIAYKLGKVTKYTDPMDLIAIGVKHPPQSFMYI